MNPLLPAVILLALAVLIGTVAIAAYIAAFHDTDHWPQ